MDRFPRFSASGLLVLVLSGSALAIAEEENSLPPHPEGKQATAAAGEEEFLPVVESVVVATRAPHDTFDLPHSVTVADRVTLARRNQIVAVDALNERIGIWVEKRNGVSSDPVIRGFSGGNILALVDGNSLTTLWGEGGYAGDDMYGKVDGASIERIEVIRGPGSVLYGSNSLGGVINFITRRPPQYTSGTFDLGGSMATSFWSATGGVMLRGDVFGAKDRFCYRLGYTMRDIGDTRGGGDLGLLSPSGVNESNFDWNSEIQLSRHDTLELNAQVVNRNGLPKYFRPNQRNDNDRRAASVRWRSTDVGFADEMSWTVYFQDKKDQRYWLNEDKYGFARWQTFSTDFQTLTVLSEDHLLTWGLHYSRDDGESPDDEQFTITTPATGTQKAAPDSLWEDIGLFAQDEWFMTKNWSLTGSARLDFFSFDASNNVYYTNPGATIAENVPQQSGGTHEENALTGGLGLVRRLDPGWMAYGSWSRGYRLFPPGFGLRQVAYGVLAPTEGFLDPTTADQFEIGTRFRRSWWSLGMGAYYSFLRDVQQPVPGEWNGMSEIDLDGSGTIDADESIYVTTGADGHVTGIEIDAAIDLGHLLDGLEGWTWLNGSMVNCGRVEFDSGEEPLRHTHPPRFLTALRWEHGDAQRGLWFEFVGDFVGRYDQVSDSRLRDDPGYLKDPQDPQSGMLRPYGLPAYTVFHVRGGLNLSETTQLTVGVENLLDKEYRSAHSRMDASGRNVMVGLRVSL